LRIEEKSDDILYMTFHNKIKRRGLVILGEVSKIDVYPDLVDEKRVSERLSEGKESIRDVEKRLRNLLCFLKLKMTKVHTPKGNKVVSIVQ